MPISPTFPGVYIEEIPSGVRSITGVATSITAFIGRALRGPVNTPRTINNFGDYERQFGGLWADSMMSYAVRDFYQNGGSRAVIIRLVKDAPKATITLPVLGSDALILEAANEGGWGKNLSALVNYKTNPDVADPNLFNLIVIENGGATETFLNVSTDPKDARYLVQVLKNTSELVRVKGETMPATRPNETFNIELPTGPQKPPLVLKSIIAQGSKLTAKVDYDPSAATDLFNLTLTETGKTPEPFPKVSTNPASPRYLPKVLTLAEVVGNMPPDRPSETPQVSSQLKISPATMALDVKLSTGTATPALLLRTSNRMSAKVDYTGIGATDTDQFNLTLTEDGKPAVPPFAKVSTKSTSSNYLPTVLKASTLSESVRIIGEMPLVRPSVATVEATEAPDGYDLTNTEYTGTESPPTGLNALLNAEFNLLCIPPAKRDSDTTPKTYTDALTLCIKKRAMLIVDPPANWGISAVHALETAEQVLAEIGATGFNARNAALYFPRILEIDPKRDGQLDMFVPCGLIAGIMARTDATRGVWKSPAGLDASLNGVQGLQVNLTDDQNGMLNPLGINCLRQFPVTGRVVWGARTLRGADRIADTDNKYIAVRRTTLFIEESLYRGTQWVVFEPNDEPLWAQIRLNVGAFMHTLFRQGAFQGKTPREAYLVKCDKETTTQTDINQGVVNILVGFAPLKPAELVFIKIQQLSGQIDV